MELPRKVEYNGVTIDVDFTDEEWRRRGDEAMRRALGMKASFDLETGQPYEGEQLSPSELKRRGY